MCVSQLASALSGSRGVFCHLSKNRDNTTKKTLGFSSSFLGQSSSRELAESQARRCVQAIGFGCRSLVLFSLGAGCIKASFCLRLLLVSSTVRNCGEHVFCWLLRPFFKWLTWPNLGIEISEWSFEDDLMGIERACARLCLSNQYI